MPAPSHWTARADLAEVARGNSIRAAGSRFAVSPSTAIKLMQRCARPEVPQPNATAAIAVLFARRMKRICAAGRGDAGLYAR